MFDRIKEYITYKRNKKIAKRELARMLSTTLPVIREFAEHKTDTLDFIKNTALTARDMDGSELVNMFINSIADMFSVSHERFVEVGSYLINLSPDEMQKILVHSMVENYWQGVKMDNQNLNKIAENIRKENPIFTDKLLDLLYEYFNERNEQYNERNWEFLKNDKNFNNMIQNLLTKQLR